MRPYPDKPLLWTTLTLLPLLTVLFSPSVLAAPRTEASEPEPSETAPAIGTSGEANETSQAVENDKNGKAHKARQRDNAASADQESPGPDNSSLAVERLPASAWPAPKTRGIHGGSLYLSGFHGLQWPYIPKTGIGVSGGAWVDTGYQKISRGNAQRNTTYWLQQGRAVLRLTPTYSNGRFFVQAQGELVGNKDQNSVQPNVADTDDLWLRVGVWNAWDIQAGRYEGWELYHLGMGMDLNTLERQGATESASSAFSPPDFYGTTFGFYRPSGVGNVAFHAYPTHFLRFEMLGHAGNDTVTGLNTVGGRPAAILDFGIIRIKGGAEYRVSTHRDTDLVMEPVVDANGQPVLNPDMTPMFMTRHVPGKTKNTEKGFGGTIQLILDPYFELGVSGAQGYVRKIDQNGGLNAEGTSVTTTIGGFANVRVIERLIAGVGVHWTTLVDEHRDSLGNVGYFAHLQGFGAIQYLVAGQLFVKAVFGYARADIEPSFQTTKYSNTMISGRLRLMYLF